MVMYYDVVVGIYDNEKCNLRISSEFVFGSFETEKRSKTNQQIYNQKYPFEELAKKSYVMYRS